MDAKFWLRSKTMLFGLTTAVAPAALDYVGGVDWTAFGVHPAAAAILGAGIMALRAVTSQPVRK